MTKRTRLSTAGLIFGVLFLVAACSRESNQTQQVTTTTEKGTSTAPPAKEVQKRDNVLIRVVHAIPKGPAVDLFADDEKAFDNVHFGKVTPYREIPDKLRANFTIRITGRANSQPLAENSETIESGNHYTVIAFPDSDGHPTLTVVNDDLKPPDSHKAKVRFINASPDAGEVDVYPRTGKDALFDGVNFKSEAGYREVDPMRTTLEVRPEGKKNVLLTIPNTSLEAGKIYTIVLAGRTKAGQKLEAFTIEDELGTPTALSSFIETSSRAN